MPHLLPRRRSSLAFASLIAVLPLAAACGGSTSASSSDGGSKGSSSTHAESSGASRSSNASSTKAPVADAGTSTSAQSSTWVSVPDATTPTPDSSTPTPDSSTPGHDATVPDSTTPGTDSSTPPPGDAGGLVKLDLFECQEAIYTTNVTIGGNQTFQLTVDTGSGPLVIPDSACTECLEAGAPFGYSPGSTGVADGTTTLAYGSGSTTADVFKDNVSVSNSPVANVTFAAMLKESGIVSNAGCDNLASDNGLMEGIVGFGPLAGQDGLNPGHGKTNLFWQQLAAAQGLPNAFSIELCYQNGHVWVGGYDPSYAAGPMQYTPRMNPTGMIGSEYWQVDLQTVTVAGTTVTIANGSNATLDTGTSIWMVTKAAMNSIAGAIEASPAFQSIVGTGDAGGGQFFSRTGCMNMTSTPCFTSSLTEDQLDQQLPSVSMTFGTGASAITVDAPATQSYLGNVQGQWCQTVCESTMLGATFSSTMLGSPILRSNLIVYDMDNQQIGFAPHTACQ